MIQGIRLYLPFVKDNEEIMQSTKEIIKQCQEDKVINVQSEVSLLLSQFTDVLDNWFSLFVYIEVFESVCWQH